LTPKRGRPTIAGYADRLSLLAERGATWPCAASRAIRTRSVLDLRDGLRAGVLALIRTPAEAAVPNVDRRARDRRLDDVERRRRHAMRREIEALTADPDRVARAAMAARLAAHPVQLDEPDSGTAVTLADLLELD
jgi:hypothetical protein